MTLSRYATLGGSVALAALLAACDPADTVPEPQPAPDPAPQPHTASDGVGAVNNEPIPELARDPADPLDASPDTAPAADGLIEALSQYCGQSFEGEITSPPVEMDGDFAGQRLVMHVRECFEDEVRVPFHVGDNHSRTWLITRLDDGRLRLKHDHRHEDGSEDTLTQYGGESVFPPVSARVEFPADQFSKDLFEREGIPVSMDNTWIMEVTDTTFVYTLTRPNRLFEVTFDLTNPVDTPPTPWGWEGEE
ncbi:hypothetical protein [Glycocaulis alkaliphilus]|uniref:hypothetical protein n=1 Tax=Glycocaulis alkaliphilus TaxID=1434191 RepID=UPI000FDB2566|nr:hypothetical protein [Glycocaulis alkaliphilus]GGB72323.1 hypothetical protein GCM10007417_10210 [Glycocaulis alkaliphilus]